MSIFRFTVDAKPEPWQRAGSFGAQRFSPKAMKAYQRVIQWAAKAAGVKRATPVALLVRCAFEPMKAKGRPVPNSNRTGDADNLAKNVMDALQKLCYDDDGEVLLLVASKEFCQPGELPRTEVQVVPLTRLEEWSVRAGRFHAVAAKLLAA